MLVKLLKYDLKYMLKNMIIFYILTIFFSISTRILFAIDDSVILKIISQISVGCMFSMMASILINTLMRSWVRFRDSIYKDEAYLTHTLPVTKNDIYNSKLFQTLIFFVISFSIARCTSLIEWQTINPSASYDSSLVNTILILPGRGVPEGRLSLVFLPIIIICPIVIFLKYAKSFGRWNNSRPL